MKNVLAATIVAIAATLCAGPAQAVEIDWPEPNWPEIFEPNQLLVLHLEMDPCDWQAILHNSPGPDPPDCILVEIEKPAMFWMSSPNNEEHLKIRVAVRRKKGFAFPDEVNPQKVALKIDINEYYPKEGDPNNCIPGTEPGDKGYCDPNAATEWHGMKKLSLEVNIDSMDIIAEGVAINIHRMASPAQGYGWPVWYGNWVKLYVNDDCKGVYVNAEQRDKQFLRHHDIYISHDSWLYKYADCEPGFVLKVGDDDFPKSPAVEALCYAPFVNAVDADPDLRPAGGECPVPDDANVVADMNQWVNMQGLLAMTATDAFLANSGVLFQNSENTYFFDFNLLDPCETRKRMYFPWDADSSFKSSDQDIYYTDSSETYEEVILQKPLFRSQYNQIMRDLLDGSLTFQDINDFLDMVEPVITDAVEADSYAMFHLFDRWGASSAAECFGGIRSWFAERIDNVHNQVAWDDPISPPGIVLLDDGFEGAVWDANWTHGASWLEDTVDYAHGLASATAYEAQNGSFTSNTLDANYATAIHIDFWFMKDDTDVDGDLLLYYLSGDYNDVFDLDTLGGDDEWLHYTDTITDSNYFNANFKIRFSSTAGKNEQVWVDDVYVTKEILDADNDQIPDQIDNCPGSYNPDQTDTDGDGVGDDCDGCPADPNKIDPGICGCGVSDIDSDGDGTADCLDGCPADPNKTDPGVCGCGVSDIDSDGDGTADCIDGCPADPNKTEPGQCGCGVADTDTDSDGTADCIDNCPSVSNPDQNDVDLDGVGTVCDNCPDAYNPGQVDSDADGIGDECECDRANLDGINPVNFGDFAIVGADWQLTGSGLAGDTNWNLVVDIEDLVQIAEHWLSDCSLP